MNYSQETVTDTSVDEKSCGCQKKTCALGLLSIAIGIGGFILASIM